MTALTASRIAAVRLASPTKGPLGPRSTSWRTATEVEVALEPTPLALQPSAYVQTAWADRKYGVVPSVKAAAALADGALHIRLRWKALNPRPAISDNNVYADGCALLFPLDGVGAELSTMGDEARPVQAWQWRAGTALPFVVRATGLGTVTRQATPHGVTVDANWADDEWTVVFSRPLTEPGVPLRQGAEIPVGIAIWQGALEERAGLASHTPAWLTLDLPA